MATAYIGEDRFIPHVQSFQQPARLASGGTVAATKNGARETKASSLAPRSP
jgi:hypothetical protein